MNSKILNLLLLLTSLIGYLEWGGDNHSFLFEAEAEILSHIITNPSAIVHPFIILPMIGQFLLLITLFQSPPNKLLSYISIGCLGILLVFILLVGCLSANYKIIASTIPFIGLSIIAIRHYRTL